MNELIRRARAGDAEATNVVSAHLLPTIRRLITRRLGPGNRQVEDSGDIAQEIVWEILGKLDRFDDKDPLSHIMKYLRGKLVQWRVLDRQAGPVTPMSLAGDCIKEEVPPTGPVTRQDDVGRLREMLDRLPPGWAEVIRLRAFEELSYAEIGRRLRRSEDAARKLYDRAYRALEEVKRRYHFGSHGGEPPGSADADEEHGAEDDR